MQISFIFLEILALMLDITFISYSCCSSLSKSNKLIMDNKSQRSEFLSIFYLQIRSSSAFYNWHSAQTIFMLSFALCYTIFFYNEFSFNGTKYADKVNGIHLWQELNSYQSRKKRKRKLPWTLLYHLKMHLNFLHYSVSVSKLFFYYKMMHVMLNVSDLKM